MSLGRPKRIGIQHPYGAVIMALRTIWFGLVVFNEVGTFKNHVRQCSWPDSALGVPPTAASGDIPRPVHVLVLADPQILDSHSYPGRNPWLIVDRYLRKSWVAALRLKPDVVIFLGDMMDDGRDAMLDVEYEEYYQRFKKIFRTDSSEPLPTYYLPGNHDIGLGTSSQFSDRAAARYTSHFGPLNQVLKIGQHIFVLINAPELAEEEDRRSRSGLSYAQWASQTPDGVVAFVLTEASRNSHETTILLTHIPLSRPDDADCGLLRERGTIRKGFGLGYQNTLAPQTSAFLLSTVRPSLVMSGDDHDYCEYVHTYNAPDPVDLDRSTSMHAKEVTVKSFSMVMGIREPGFQLLSLSSYPSSMPANTLATTPCLLPDQMGIYLGIYVPAVIISLIILLASNMHRVRTRGRWVEWAPVPDWCQRLRCARKVTFRGRTVTLMFPLPRPTGSDGDKMTSTRGDKERAYAQAGLVKGLMIDALSVAVVPVVAFLGLMWWVS